MRICAISILDSQMGRRTEKVPLNSAHILKSILVQALRKICHRMHSESKKLTCWRISKTRRTSHWICNARKTWEEGLQNFEYLRVKQLINKCSTAFRRTDDGDNGRKRKAVPSCSLECALQNGHIHGFLLNGRRFRVIDSFRIDVDLFFAGVLHISMFGLRTRFFGFYVEIGDGTCSSEIVVRWIYKGFTGQSRYIKGQERRNSTHEGDPYANYARKQETCKTAAYGWIRFGKIWDIDSALCFNERFVSSRDLIIRRWIWTNRISSNSL